MVQERALGSKDLRNLIGTEVRDIGSGQAHDLTPHACVPLAHLGSTVEASHKLAPSAPPR